MTWDSRKIPLGGSDLPIEIVSYVDEGFAPHLAAMLRSVEAHLAPGRRAVAHVIHLDVSEASARRVERSVESAGRLQVRWYRADPAPFAEFQVSSRISITSYLRLGFDRLVAPETNRILLLDSDLIVQESLHLLSEMDLGGKAIGAALDVACPYVGMVDRGMFSGLGRDPWSPVFNAGVLVVDVESWTRRGVVSAARALASEFDGKYLFHDQCLLNQIFDRDWRRLPLAWNQQTAVFQIERGVPASREELVEARLRPKIVHYTSDRKPWTGATSRPFADLYHRYATQTAFPVRREPRGALQRLRHQVHERWLNFKRARARRSIYSTFFARYGRLSRST